MRRINALLTAGIMILFLLHLFRGVFIMLGVVPGGSDVFGACSYLMLVLTAAHIAIGCKLTYDTLTAIRKSGIRLPFIFVRFSRYAIITQMIMPSVAAMKAASKLFRADFRIDDREKIFPQNFSVAFPDAKTDFPIFRVKEVEMTERNGITTTMKAKSPTRTVRGIRHFRRSTIFGRTDFPEMVI